MTAPLKSQPAPRERSAVTNGGRTFLEPGFGNTETARRFRDLLSEAERKRGGKSAMSIAAQSAARAWAGLAVLLELTQASLARGDTVDPNEMGRIADRMTRQSRAMGPPSRAQARS